MFCVFVNSYVTNIGITIVNAGINLRFPRISHPLNGCVFFKLML